MKKRILTFLVVAVMLFSTLSCFCTAATSHYESLTPGTPVQDHLDAGGKKVFSLVADEDQYYEFKIRNQSIEVNTGIGFADGFLNLFLGKMNVRVYDAYDDVLSDIDVKCGYTATVTVMFKKDARYYIEVSSTVSGNFNLTAKKLADLGANTWGDATATESTGETVSEIEAQGDKDWFKFTTDELRSYYYFSLENLQADKMYIYLYEYVPAADNLRDVDHFSASTNTIKTYNYQLKPNTDYYMCIYSDGTGDYILNVERNADAAGNTRSDAEAYAIEEGIKYTTSFDGDDDYDYYVFTTGSKDAYYHVEYTYLSFKGRAYSTIYDADGNEVEGSSAYEANFKYNARLKPDSKYYVRFLGDGVGNYEFKVTANLDEYPNERDHAKSVDINKEYSTSFNGNDDYDYVKFTTPANDAYYHVEYKYLSFKGRAYAVIYDAEGNEVESSSAYEADFKFNARLEPGSVYYVRFYGDGVGNYKFKISANNDEYPNSHDLAKKIDINKEYSTAFNGVKDDDYVKFTTAAYNAYYHVEYTYVGFKGRAYAYIYDTEGNEINSSSYYEGNFSFAEKLEPNTEYVVRFYGDGVGNYKFKIRAAKDADGDTMESATKLTLNQKYQTSFESKNDIDWFRVDLSQPVNLLVSLYCESVNGGYFEIYNERLAKLASQGYISSGSTASKSVQVDAGTYYIKARCAAAGYYTVTVSPCGGGHTEVTDYGKLATCTSPGLTEGKHCSLCGTVTKKQTVINPKGHKFSKGSCTVCGTKDPNYIPTFTDVKAGAWYKKAVDHVAKHGLVSGMSATTFEPDTKVSRAMFVTIIARMAGVDTSSAANKAARTPFSDVPSGKYYSAAVAWGSKTGIVAGTSKSAFSPDANITREQLCSLIVRYAEYHGIDIKSKKAEMKFADAGSISNYAKEAVRKCQMAGIVSGYNDGTFGPKGNAKRSEAAQILYVFHSDYVLK